MQRPVTVGIPCDSHRWQVLINVVCFFFLKGLSWMDPFPVSCERKPFSVLTGHSQTSAPSWALGVLKIHLQREITFFLKSNSMSLCERYWQGNRIPMSSPMGCAGAPRIKDIAITKMCWFQLKGSDPNCPADSKVQLNCRSREPVQDPLNK